MIDFYFELGIVLFSSSAATRSNLVQIRNETDRQRLVSLLPTSAGGSTSIGAGILRGINVRLY